MSLKKGITYGTIIGALGLGLGEFVADVESHIELNKDEKVDTNMDVYILTPQEKRLWKRFQDICPEQSYEDIRYHKNKTLKNINANLSPKNDRIFECFWENGQGVARQIYKD